MRRRRGRLRVRRLLVLSDEMIRMLAHASLACDGLAGLLGLRVRSQRRGLIAMLGCRG